MADQTPPQTPIDDLSDRQLLVRLVKIAEHLDPMIHEIHGWARTAAPFLERLERSKSLFGRRGQGNGS